MGVSGPESRKTFSKARAANLGAMEFVHEGRRANVDAHCPARSFVSLLVGRHRGSLYDPSH